MPVVGPEYYNIDFLIVDSNDPKTIVLMDTSTYLEQPELPVIDVIPPGYTGYIQIPYLPNSTIVLNSDDLKFTDNCEFEYLADLPDGVYQIKMKVCPYNQLFKKQCFLKDTIFYRNYQTLLLSFDQGCDSYDTDSLKSQMLDLDILVQSAKAEVAMCNVDRGVQKFQAAMSALDRINQKLNCKV